MFYPFSQLAGTSKASLKKAWKEVSQNLPDNEYRIVEDSAAGFEVQIRRWYLPFWTQVNINTHESIEDARLYARTHAADLLEIAQGFK